MLSLSTRGSAWMIVLSLSTWLLSLDDRVKSEHPLVGPVDRVKSEPLLVGLDDRVKSEYPLVSLDDCVKSEPLLVGLDDGVKLPGESVRTFRGSRRICDRGPHPRDVGPEGLCAVPSEGRMQRGRFWQLWGSSESRWLWRRGSGNRPFGRGWSGTGWRASAPSYSVPFTDWPRSAQKWPFVKTQFGSPEYTRKPQDAH